MAPATQLSSTSLTEQFSALPTALTSSRGIGWHQATHLAVPALPLSRVLESSAIRASAAASLSTWYATLARSVEPLTPFPGSRKRCNEAAAPSPAASSALTAAWASGSTTWWAIHSSGLSGAEGVRTGGSVPPSTMDIVTAISAMPSAMQ